MDFSRFFWQREFDLDVGFGEIPSREKNTILMGGNSKRNLQKHYLVKNDDGYQIPKDNEDLSKLLCVFCLLD